MKKILLLFFVTSFVGIAQSQVVFSGVSPVSIQGNYPFGVQTDYGWPRYDGFGGPTSENWGLALDFSVDGTHVQEEIVLVNDGTAGTHPTFGYSIGEQGCNASTAGAYNGKIAVLRRGSCAFTVKAKNAQDAGAIAVIVIDTVDSQNRENFYLSADAAGDGPNVTIPVIMIDNSVGNSLVAELQNGAVEVFIGNKLGVFPNDLAAIKGEYLISPFATHNSLLMDGFDLGIQVYNYGSATQSSATVNATIVGPGSVEVYNETVNLPAMLTGDTVAVFNGNPEEFPSFDLGGVGSYPVGDYTLTYTIDLGTSDDSDYDNVYSSQFSVTDDRLSLARNNAGEPLINSYPSNTDGEYESCMFFEDPNASLLAMKGIYFAPYTDTAVNELEGAEIFINVYEWDDTWTDIDDPNITANNDFFTSLNLIAAETHYPASDNDNGLVQYVPLSIPIQFDDNQRYLICNQTYAPEISFGYDNGVDYGGNVGIFRMPVSPIEVINEGTNNALTWFIAGWNGSPGNGIMLDVFDSSTLGLNDEAVVNGKAFPNPTNNNVTIALEATGNGQLTVTDVSGKIALNQSIALVNGQTKVDLSKLDDGVYIFNVELENGKTSQFNVVKN